MYKDNALYSQNSIENGYRSGINKAEDRTDGFHSSEVWKRRKGSTSDKFIFTSDTG
jgi:hypothetical protein